MRPYCEVVVKELLPALRSVLAKEMLDAGLKQDKIAEKLQLTQPAVSHYIKQARGKQVQLLIENEKIHEQLKRLAHELINEDKQDKLAFCGVCRNARGTGMLCQFEPKMLEACRICLLGHEHTSGYS